MNHLAGPSTDPALLPRLRRLARFVRAFILVGAAGLVVGTAWNWSSPERAMGQMKTFVDRSFHVSAQNQAVGALFTLIPVVVLLMALHRLWGVFGEYEHGRVFSRRALVDLRGFASWLMINAVVSPVYGAAMSVVATWENGRGRREINLQLDANDYVMLLFGLVVLAISSVMAEAARVAEDNAGFV